MKYRLAAFAVFAACSLFHPDAKAAEDAITADLASRIIKGCVDHSTAKKQSHAIAIVDEGAHLIAFLRMEGNTPGVAEFAMAKAEAVGHWHFSTADMNAAAKETPGFAAAPHVVTVAGGIPVYSRDGSKYIGAVGVSGEAPEDDAACAEAGVTAAGLSLARKSPQS
ncbi:MAG: GlcG/HbpS family heme-binding protein [Povalibacter sp.]